jgi:hypothetical protein
MKLTTQKWSKIMALSKPFINSAVQMGDDTEGEDLGDSRGLIQVSDDYDNEAVVSRIPPL